MPGTLPPAYSKLGGNYVSVARGVAHPRCAHPDSLCAAVIALLFQPVPATQTTPSRTVPNAFCGLVHSPMPLGKLRLPAMPTCSPACYLLPADSSLLAAIDALIGIHPTLLFRPGKRRRRRLTKR